MENFKYNLNFLLSLFSEWQRIDILVVQKICVQISLLKSVNKSIHYLTRAYYFSKKKNRTDITE